MGKIDKLKFDMRTNNEVPTEEALMLKNRDDYDNEKSVWLPTRYMIAIMGCAGLATLYGNQVNASMCLIAMVNHTAISLNRTNIVSENIVSTCDTGEQYEANATKITAATVRDGPFVWDQSIQGLVLSCYFWGFLASQIPSGRIAEIFSAKWLFLTGVLVNIVACLLSPIAAHANYAYFMVLRVLQGAGEGVACPAMHALIAKWSPPAERNMFTSIIYSGICLGIIVTMGLTGVLIDRIGWASMFYVQGCLPLIWCILWYLFVSDSPEQQTKFITQREKDFIQRSLKNSTRRAWEKKLPVPWGKVLRSAPFWAVVVSHSCSHFAWILVLTELPSYLFHMMKFTQSQSAGLLVIMYFCMWISALIIGRTLSHLHKTGRISMLMSRRIAMVIANFVPMCCFIGISFVQCEPILVVVILITVTTSFGGGFSGFFANIIDLAPNFSGSLMAFSGTAASIAALISPMAVVSILKGNHTMDAWRKVFWLAAGVYAIDVVSYLVFSSTDVQPWNALKKSEEKSVEQPRPKDEANALKNNEET